MTMFYTLSQGKLLDAGGGTANVTNALTRLEVLGLIRIVDRWKENGIRKAAYTLTAQGRVVRRELFGAGVDRK